jgi:hypothetical protein
MKRERLHIRLPADLKDLLFERSLKNDCSVSDEVIAALHYWLGYQPKPEPTRNKRKLVLVIRRKGDQQVTA